MLKMVNYMEKHQSIQKARIANIGGGDNRDKYRTNGKVKGVWIKEYPGGMICFQVEVKPERMEQ